MASYKEFLVILTELTSQLNAEYLYECNSVSEIIS